MARFLVVLKQCLIYGIIAILGVPVTLLIMIFTNSQKALAAASLQTPVEAKVVVRENPPGEDDQVFGLPGALTAGSQAEISLNNDFTGLLGETLVNSDGSFEQMSLGDNLVATFYLRSTLKKAVSAKITLENDITPPKASGVVRGLNPDQTYFQGEKISLRLTLGERKIAVWARTGDLDGSFPEKVAGIYLSDGIWSLETPTLSSNLNPGSRIIKIFAQDQAGNTLIKKVPVYLKKLSALTIIKAQVDARNLVDLTWQKVPNVKGYLVEWNVQGESLVENKLVDDIYNTSRIRNLLSGTYYEIRVIPIGLDGSLGEKAEIVIKTLGIKLGQEVAGIETEKVSPQAPIKPAIGKGVATTRPVSPKVAAKPSQITPTEQPSSPPKQETPEETQKNNWSRLLVALAILVIAAGAAIGGYYGYEWYVAREDKEPPEPKSSDRW